MFSSDFQCLARTAYESSDDSHEGNDDSIFERCDSISPPPRSPLLQNRDISKFSRIGGDMEPVDLDETRWNSQVGQSKNKNSRRFSLNHDSKPTTTNSSIHYSTPRFSDRSDFKNRCTQSNKGVQDDGKDFPSHSSRSGQLSAATLNNRLLSSIPAAKKSVQEPPSKLQQAFHATESNRSSSKKRKIATFTTLFEKPTMVQPITAGPYHASMNENLNNVREIQFGPSFIQKKEKTHDDVEDEPFIRLLDEEEQEKDGTQLSNLDHSPFASKTSRFNSNRSTKHPNGQFIVMLNSIRRNREETLMRLTSGSYPPTRNDINDPRSRASLYVDLTIIGDSKSMIIPGAAGEKYVVYDCYIHSFVCKKTQTDIITTGPTTSYRHRSKKIHALNHEHYSSLYPVNLMSFSSEDFESTSRRIYFSMNVLKGMVLCRGSCFRVYDPIVVPLKFKDRCDMDSASSTSSILLCTRFYEPCPDNHPLSMHINVDPASTKE